MAGSDDDSADGVTWKITLFLILSEVKVKGNFFLTGLQ